MILVDITMLAWPGWQGMLARKRWVTQYGKDDLPWYQKRAEVRHQYWIDRGCTLRLVQNTRDPADSYHTRVEARCKEHGLCVDERGFCPKD